MNIEEPSFTLHPTNPTNNRLVERLKELRKQYQRLEELKKVVVKEFSATACLLDRLPEFYEQKYIEKFKCEPPPFHFSKDRVPPLDERQLEVGCSHLLNPSIELENFPQLIDLNEDNFFRTKEEIENCQREEEEENKNESNEDIKKSIDEFLLNENEIIDGEDVSSDEVKLPRLNSEKEMSQLKKQAKK
ncbi:hypothetical protein EHI8A_008290 [Entamoeba histolytica HM-1:IMSS-B]|uniref:Uncharacterized protein n=6 Tax=Entamoeba histolytica TaxID=5759 RepID=C4M1A1_ENTH1|nr:hypothetical protein EHI_188270 [Entamoeba histolytica HM-1:IMSS]EMD49256.1 Hypothetical protein EHI5A_003660 [Entamoeba histolytica KU27]EMH72239.1 hypothetical protein EHI8A_008290 [Entamoeba histolytica HM-1:IMSS-B]EMS12168.1 hypothetical protein KM1_022560 [Entamoeba histolytica HM-3:IMSS]ENY59997.1 hypothetical protein EHI7A_111130 [Entamoeba histolytica HM-1:IMSS-A]GAT94977.1 hypothetical protein CL6EHI_188270 [Entamoeba histolytica]|eukprot:XP_653695.1 hypothetical protein EHI_188270 [Entamoeba histolytica HM-1:IMSS]